MKKPLLALALVALSYGGGATANDFPTQARVEFVLACMGERGGQSYDTLYPCICMIDRIASRIAYREYTAAETLSFLYGTPGERGGHVPRCGPAIEEAHQGVPHLAPGGRGGVLRLPGRRRLGAMMQVGIRPCLVVNPIVRLVARSPHRIVRCAGSETDGTG